MQDGAGRDRRGRSADDARIDGQPGAEVALRGKNVKILTLKTDESRNWVFSGFLCAASLEYIVFLTEAFT
jgi:hypothetical protein